MHALCRLHLHQWQPWRPALVQRLQKTGWNVLRARCCKRCNHAQLRVVTHS